MENYFLSPDDSFNLYKLLHKVVKIFEKNNIIYWATGGTFLGAIRSNGIIKWDDDIDLCILLEHKKKVINAIKYDNDLIFDDFSSFVNKIRYKNNKYPFIDIFFMIKDINSGNTIYKCAVEKHRNLWKNEIYLEKEIVPLKKIKFGAMKISIPNEYERYFNTTYGKNWRNTGSIGYDHKNEKNNPNLTWVLKETDYDPATPFYIEELFENNDNKNRWWQY